MKTSDFRYELPPELIAQTPADPRDSSRMLVLNRQSGETRHGVFRDLPSHMRAGDVLVVNRSRVMPARLLGELDTGKPAELLLLRRIDNDAWETLVKPGKKLREGARITFGGGRLLAVIERVLTDGNRIARFTCGGVFEAVLEELGQTPLPPYITARLDDRERYQTVYSKEQGSAAAPTAGLHFTHELLCRLRAIGVSVAEVLLHVGLGTFRPVKTEDISGHIMHEEWYELSEDAAQTMNAARAAGGRVFCVGTTSVRVLETCADISGALRAQSGWTGIFITPGYRFKAVDALITNFHLPESTLLMLVSAFAGREHTLAAYREAVAERYRFFSFGDAMLIL